MSHSRIIRDSRDLAEVVANLPFAVLMGVAKELVELNAENEYNRHPETPLGLAETLSDWANAQLEDE